MKRIVLILCCIVPFGIRNGYSQKLIDIKIYYHDTVTTERKDEYRELTQITEEPFWAKPENIDIILEVSGANKSVKEKIEIIIEELYEPTGLNESGHAGITKATWVPHVVVYSGNTNFVRRGKISVYNFPYKTAYFKSSLLYRKIAFRIVGIYFNSENRTVERVEKKIVYTM